jgi:LPS export ABC transporter protein LptC
MLGGAAAAAACAGGADAPGSARDALPDSADQVMVGLRHQLTNAGVRRAQLYADTAFFYDEGNRIELRNVRTVFFTATGDSNATMTGRRGTYDVRQQKLDGRGDVLLVSVDGRRLASPHLVYDRIANQVTSDTTFTFTEPGRALSGVGLRTDPQLRNVQVLRGAKGRAELSGDELSRPGGPTPLAGAPPAARVPSPAAPTPRAPVPSEPAPADPAPGNPAPGAPTTPPAPAAPGSRPSPPPGAEPRPSAPLPRTPTNSPTLPPAGPPP